MKKMRMRGLSTLEDEYSALGYGIMDQATAMARQEGK